jgi:hypothetical protein
MFETTSFRSLLGGRAIDVRAQPMTGDAGHILNSKHTPRRYLIPLEDSGRRNS